MSVTPRSWCTLERSLRSALLRDTDHQVWPVLDADPRRAIAEVTGRRAGVRPVGRVGVRRPLPPLPAPGVGGSDVIWGVHSAIEPLTPRPTGVSGSVDSAVSDSGKDLACCPLP